MNDARIRWQCRRGTRELDDLLLGWFDSFYRHASESQKSAFCRLLELQDPELMAYLLGGATPEDPETRHVVNAILGRTAPG